MSEPVIPEQWSVASGSGYIELSQQSYAALGSRIDAAEAKVAELSAFAERATGLLQGTRLIDSKPWADLLRAGYAALTKQGDRFEEKVSEHPIHGPVTISVTDDTRKLGEALEQIKTLQAENLALRELILELEPDADIDELLEVE